MKLTPQQFLRVKFEIIKHGNGTDLKLRYEELYELLQGYVDHCEKEAVKKQDALLGRLLRENEDLKDTNSRRSEWLRKAKSDAGFADSVSFDEVWKAALEAYLKPKKIL